MENFSALPWAAWAAALAVVLTSTTNAVLLGATALSCWVTMWVVGGPRAALSRVVVGASLALAALWALLGVFIRREGLGGQVVWFLPEWSPQSGGDFGGAVTAGQLHFATARGLQAIAIVAVIGVLAQAVSASGWLTLAHTTWGRLVRVVGPMLCLGQAYVEQREVVVASRRAGFSSPGATATVSGVVARAEEIAQDWTAHARPVSSTVRTMVALAVTLIAVGWWVGGTVDTRGVLPLAGVELSGMERTLVVLIVLTLVGSALRRSLPTPAPADLAPALSAGVIALAWYARSSTGDAAGISAVFDQLPTVPWALVGAVATLPVLALAARGRR